MDHHRTLTKSTVIFTKIPCKAGYHCESRYFMLRPALLLLVFALAGAQAQQVEPHGPAASVLSPTSDGRSHGIPASVLSPSPRNGVDGRVVFDPRRFPVRFGKPPARRRAHKEKEFVPVPIFIPGYALPADYIDPQAEAAANEEYAPDPNAATDSDALREAYFRGAHDALAREQADARYGEHYLDSREKNAAKASANEPSAGETAASAKPEPTEETPPTVFIFKDGHKLQTQNYAIVGQTLYDLSNNQVHKIQLAELDLDATKKANDDLGIVLRLP
jgi:hypothetical protein